jgi:DNA gyrase/topoisomerase IV subunit A
MNSSQYIDKERRDYALYVMNSRSIPHLADGLKNGGRRVLWTARNGKLVKTSTLAGATMPIHPHAAPEGSIQTLAAPYGNNVPLFKGEGGFGTLLNPGAFAAPRYTSVKVSNFTNEVVFKDIDLVPMQENYDGTLMEPSHFLPLVPIVLLNPQDGIAVGFATTILPRDLGDIVKAQIEYLSYGRIKSSLTPKFTPTNQVAQTAENEKGLQYIFKGEVEIINNYKCKIISLPYGISHEKYIERLIKLLEKGTISDYTDDSTDTYDIEITFKRGYFGQSGNKERVLQTLGLVNRISETLTLINFDGKSVWSPNNVEEIIERFTHWRLGWYKERYVRLRDSALIDLRKCKDILLAIKNDVGGKARSIENRTELKTWLSEIYIHYVDYIADFPVYRFTETEKKKVEERLKELERKIDEYEKLINNEELRKNIYIDELKDVRKKFK